MFHPGAARIDCGECQKFVYNLETGERETFRSGPNRDLVPVGRPPGTPTPCNKCPKGSPEKAKTLELSEKNWSAFAHYQESKAVGLTEAERRDPIVRRNFALMDRIAAERDRRDHSQGMAEALIAVLTSKK